MSYLQGLPIYDKLMNKILAYYQTIWRDKWEDNGNQAEDWLTNFSDGNPDSLEKEKINMLYLLSKFMYFGNRELRELLRSLYRDLVKYPIISSIRLTNDDTTDISLINSEFKKELDTTRFLGVGNPSESGVHLLYYFRQECNLSKEYFINANDIFKTTKITERRIFKPKRAFLRSTIRYQNIRRYVFIDDFCGSGSQAKDYLKNLVENLKFENPKIEVNYLMLFGTEAGIEVVKNLNVFNNVDAVFTVDETFKAFSTESRYFNIQCSDEIDKKISKETAVKYGTLLYNPPLGYGDCQLLLGLYHNTPDNSLPIFWSEEKNWKPIFKRYHKIY